MLNGSQWQPSYPSTDAFLDACQVASDPLHIRSARKRFVCSQHCTHYQLSTVRPYTSTVSMKFWFSFQNGVRSVFPLLALASQKSAPFYMLINLHLYHLGNSTTKLG